MDFVDEKTIENSIIIAETVLDPILIKFAILGMEMKCFDVPGKVVGWKPEMFAFAMNMIIAHHFSGKQIELSEWVIATQNMMGAYSTEAYEKHDAVTMKILQEYITIPS
jgi:hypothetical protein